VVTDLAPICLRFGNLVLALTLSEIHATSFLHISFIGKLLLKFWFSMRKYFQLGKLFLHYRSHPRVQNCNQFRQGVEQHCDETDRNKKLGR